MNKKIEVVTLKKHFFFHHRIFFSLTYCSTLCSYISSIMPFKDPWKPEKSSWQNLKLWCFVNLPKNARSSMFWVATADKMGTDLKNFRPLFFSFSSSFLNSIANRKTWRWQGEAFEMFSRQLWQQKPLPLLLWNFFRRR